MPIYDYECAACGERFDKLIRSINQPLPEIICPACQSKEVQRLISAPTIRAGGDSGAGEIADAPAEKSAVFGRKELLAAQEQKRQLRERAKYSED